MRKVAVVLGVSAAADNGTDLNIAKFQALISEARSGFYGLSWGGHVTCFSLPVQGQLVIFIKGPASGRWLGA